MHIVVGVKEELEWDEEEMKSGVLYTWTSAYSSEHGHGTCSLQPRSVFLVLTFFSPIISLLPSKICFQEYFYSMFKVKRHVHRSRSWSGANMCAPWPLRTYPCKLFQVYVAGSHWKKVFHVHTRNSILYDMDWSHWASLRPFKYLGMMYVANLELPPEPSLSFERYRGSLPSMFPYASSGRTMHSAHCFFNL